MCTSGYLFFRDREMIPRYNKKDNTYIHDLSIIYTVEPLL